MSHNQYFGAFDKNNCLIGFSSMNKDGYLHSMFVHKDYQCKGVATQLLSEVEKWQKWGVKEIISEVSFTARSFLKSMAIRLTEYRSAKQTN